MEISEVLRRLAITHKGVSRKAQEFARLAKVKCASSADPCLTVVCVELACRSFVVSFPRDRAASICGATKKKYSLSFNRIQSLLGIKEEVSLQSLAVRFGWENGAHEAEKYMTMLKKVVTEETHPLRRTHLNFSLPIYSAVAFYVAAQQSKVRINRAELLKAYSITTKEFLPIYSKLTTFISSSDSTTTTTSTTTTKPKPSRTKSVIVPTSAALKLMEEVDAKKTRTTTTRSRNSSAAQKLTATTLTTTPTSKSSPKKSPKKTTKTQTPTTTTKPKPSRTKSVIVPTPAALQLMEEVDSKTTRTTTTTRTTRTTTTTTTTPSTSLQKKTTRRAKRNPTTFSSSSPPPSPSSSPQKKRKRGEVEEEVTQLKKKRKATTKIIK